MKNSINNFSLIEGNRFALPHKQLVHIRETLMSGGVFMYPTDTCYALSASICSQKGIDRIFEMKNRSASKHVSIAFSDVTMLRKYAEVSTEVELFIHRYMPERCTLFLPKKQDMWRDISLLQETEIMAARIPKDIFTRKIIQSLGIPIVTTSANISGEPEVYSKHDVYTFLRRCAPLPDLTFMASLQRIPPSTIIDTTVSPWKTVREGSFVL